MIATEGVVRGIRSESINWSIALSVVLIVIGVAALAAPLFAGVVVTVLLAWLLIVAGVGHLVLAWHVRGSGAHFWEALIGLAYILAGGLLLGHPVAGLVGLTVVLGIYLTLKGLLELAASISLGRVRGGRWLILDAAISLILAVLIWRHLPFSAEWMVGTLLGFAILFTGLSRLALTLGARRRSTIAL